jgi:putative endonuclease
MNKFYVYILRSCCDNSFYIGFTQNPERRLLEHNSAKSQYTRTKIPWELVYSEAFPTKSEALKREHFLKAQKNRVFYEKLIAGK